MFPLGRHSPSLLLLRDPVRWAAPPGWVRALCPAAGGRRASACVQTRDMFCWLALVFLQGRNFALKENGVSPLSMRLRGRPCTWGRHACASHASPVSPGPLDRSLGSRPLPGPTRPLASARLLPTPHAAEASSSFTEKTAQFGEAVGEEFIVSPQATGLGQMSIQLGSRCHSCVRPV